MLIAFSLGIEHYVMTGIIQYISQDLAIPISEASYINSIYFIGVVLSGPIMIMTIRNQSRVVALTILSTFIIVGNLLIYFFPSYGILIFGRLIASLSHSAFFGLSAVIAYQTSVKYKGLSVQLISFATTIANMIGVPICAKLSQLYGWRFSFLFIALFTAVASAMMLYLEKIGKFSKTKIIIEKTSFMEELKNLFQNKSALSIVFISFINYVSFFITMSFLSVIITDYLRFDKNLLPIILILVGSGMMVGGFVGAIVYDKFHSRIAPVYLILTLILLSFTIPFLQSNKILSVFCLFLFQLISFSFVPYYKTKIVSRTLSAPYFATTMNNVFLGCGSAVGAIIGGKLIQHYPAINMLYFSGTISIITGLFIFYLYRVVNKTHMANKSLV